MPPVRHSPAVRRSAARPDRRDAIAVTLALRPVLRASTGTPLTCINGKSTFRATLTASPKRTHDAVARSTAPRSTGGRAATRAQSGE
ncbi:hypothetical protein Bcep1808_6305 [Burkholderia vietnamiensis G4]|uniref:Uncharacterized protein n=1 Tax=Burkholderia vietnamiensis (strain G4 / LMG 22486) TaxID=269482 RepID=A4JSF2_BURVG|nr:hypothetical protein Bcep1808_6305 [Burkholderia vietnamiensis G4]